MPKKPALPCGTWFCPVPLRLLWPIKAVPLTRIGACYDRSRMEMERRARILGIWDQRRHGRVPVYSVAEFTRLWLDPSLTRARIARRFGMTKAQLWLHSQRLVLPARRTGAPPVYAFGPEFDAMWKARVMAREMARVYGCHATLIHKEATRRGHAPRGKTGPRKLTLAQYRMKVEADRTAAAMVLSEMVDGRNRFTDAMERRAA
jgi:hypothetical protein